MFAPYEASAWDKVFKNGPSKICGRLSLENLKGYEAGCIPSNFLKAVFHKFYLVHYWILGLICWFTYSPLKETWLTYPLYLSFKEKGIFTYYLKLFLVLDATVQFKVSMKCFFWNESFKRPVYNMENQDSANYYFKNFVRAFIMLQSFAFRSQPMWPRSMPKWKLYCYPWHF